jgi:septal ring factor EnvC (AmiA/AmiB activator)
VNIAAPLEMARDQVAPRLIAVVLCAAGWLNAASVNNAFTVGIACATTAVAGYVAIVGKIDSDRRSRRRLDFEETLRERREAEAADRDSLSAHLADATADREKMRATLHEINNELHNRNLEYAALRQDFVTVTGQLAAANARLAEVTMAKAKGETP